MDAPIMMPFHESVQSDKVYSADNLFQNIDSGSAEEEE